LDKAARSSGTEHLFQKRYEARKHEMTDVFIAPPSLIYLAHALGVFKGTSSSMTGSNCWWVSHVAQHMNIWSITGLSETQSI